MESVGFFCLTCSELIDLDRRRGAVCRLSEHVELVSIIARRSLIVRAGVANTKQTAENIHHSFCLG